MKIQKFGKILLATLVATIIMVSALPASAALRADAIPYGTPVIDGKIDAIWSGASNKVAIDMYYEGKDSGYATGYARLMWDEKYLYVLGYAYDTTKSTKIATEQWETDGFEVFLDETNAHNTVKNSISQFRVTRGGIFSGMLNSEAVLEAAMLAEYKGTQWKAAEASDGYFVELAIPWTRATNVKANSQIGIEFQLNDDFDNNGTTDTIINSEVIDKWKTSTYRMMSLVSTKATASSSNESTENNTVTNNNTSSNNTSNNNSTVTGNSSTTNTGATESGKDTPATSETNNTVTESNVETSSEVEDDGDTVVNKEKTGMPKGALIALIVVGALIIAAIVVCLIVLLKPKKKITEDK